MDPLTALIIAMWIAGRFTKNVYQDSVYKARGEDPPSFRREQERWERKQAKRAAGDGPGRKLIGNAWADACAAADDRRQRVAERAADRRRVKWAQSDADAAEVEAREINERVQAGTEPVFTCGGCQAQIPQSDVAGFALSGDALCRDCRTAPTNPAGHAPGGGAATSEDVRRRCHACGLLKDPGDLRKAACYSCPGDEGASVDACTGCIQATRDHQETADRAFETDMHDVRLPADTQPAPETADPSGPDQAGGTVTDLTEWRTRGATPPITKEDIVSGETTNLAAALQYAQDMADQCGAGAASTETSIATMRTGGVTGSVLDHFTQAQEHLSLAMAAFNQGHSELQADIAVKDAYQARQGAGDKEFVTQD